MRFHVVALPHTNTTSNFSSCAYTQKVINFCKMMHARGHEVFLYSGQRNTTLCTEHIECTSEIERLEFLGDKHYTEASFDYCLQHWVRFNQRAADAIRQRAQQKDFLCLIGGVGQKQIADSLPHLTCVEFGVGYGGFFSQHRVFESYAWMHTCYGARSMNNPHGVDGHWLDAVIPGYLDHTKFPFVDRDGKDDYFLYVGRMIERKGVNIAAQVCDYMATKLVMVGPGTPPVDPSPFVEYLGPLEATERNRLMSRARALFVPTTYIEPFGNVAIEAMACGTPVISTDWGAMTETVLHGLTGFRCRSFDQFLKAAKSVDLISSTECRNHVVANYSLDVVGKKYEDYFLRLLNQWGEGWYETSEIGHIAA